ncbi:MAG: hypothetical protein KatS3mg099_241 [Candidatus Parcubacteria bacterium]|nr:MAG: hypothetical protein KatS3mg099_241 [Candidatus Parcubacteria bacterium]
MADSRFHPSSKSPASHQQEASLVELLRKNPRLAPIVQHPAGIVFLQGAAEIDPVCFAASVRKNVIQELAHIGERFPFTKIPQEERGLVVPFLWLWLVGLIPNEAFISAVVKTYPSIKRADAQSVLERLLTLPASAAARGVCSAAKQFWTGREKEGDTKTATSPQQPAIIHPPAAHSSQQPPRGHIAIPIAGGERGGAPYSETSQRISSIPPSSPSMKSSFGIPPQKRATETPPPSSQGNSSDRHNRAVPAPPLPPVRKERPDPYREPIEDDA